jgi:flagellar hook-basal body complex protein FliE
LTIPIDPSMLAKGAEWQVGLGPEAATGTGAQPGVGGTGSQGFGSFLSQKVGELSALQDQAAQGAQALASGQATDPTQVVMAVEKARLSMQLASQVRTKATEAINDIFHTQV